MDPVVLFKLSLLGYLFNIGSEATPVSGGSLNLDWRWFLGYELDEPIPDHSVLSKARGRFGPLVYEESSGGWSSSARREGWWRATSCSSMPP